MSEVRNSISAFVAYVSKLSGYERGEAQVYLDRLFRAFGHEGYREAGATLEYKLKRAGKPVGFPDLLWRPRLLIEMKSRGEKLQRHYQQAFEYWLNAVPDRPRYVVLCDFDSFWIYDFNVQLHEPMDRVRLDQLVDRYEALNFLFPENRQPIFENDRVGVTRTAADAVAEVFHSLVSRGETRQDAQKFILQCVVAMFAEDIDLLPKALFSEVLRDCRAGQSSYDLIGGLFRQMNARERARGGRFQDVKYFNGGLFDKVNPIELTRDEIQALQRASSENWRQVAPPIFGTLFQKSMDKARRHAFGAHFTSEVDIQAVVRPTIVKPWREKIAQASTLKELKQLTDELLRFRVLDPACGSGNFLYVAYRELVNIEMELLTKIRDNFGTRAKRAVGTASLVSTTQFFGLDRDPFAVELAKVTLMLSKRVVLAELNETWFENRSELPLEFEDSLPLDNLDGNIRREDALFCAWPKADAIVGNPPYQPKNKIQRELGAAYINRVRRHIPQVPGRADLCVYWFRLAHDALATGQRAGLVGTNTIRQNYSREGGLDYIVRNGTITEAISSQPWSGEANVHVSIVNWTKGHQPGLKKLYRQDGNNPDGPWEVVEVERIGPSLSGRYDVTQACQIGVNKKSDSCDQGQTPGHLGFLLPLERAQQVLQEDPANIEVIKPYLIGDDFLSENPPAPTRCVIDFAPRNLLTSQHFAEPFGQIERLVRVDRENALQEETRRNEELIQDDPDARPNRHHENFLDQWWHLSYSRQALLSKLRALDRYIACSRVTKRPIFVFVSSKINPSDALTAFSFDDDYSFGILQSHVHWTWFVERCSTLTERPRYTSNTVYDSFPWPQSPTRAQVKSIAHAAVSLRHTRAELMKEHELSLRDLYRTMELPGDHPLKQAHYALDRAVRAAYGMKEKTNALEFLFKLNHELAEKEVHLQPVVGPGIPPCVRHKKELISNDCIPAPPPWG